MGLLHRACAYLRPSFCWYSFCQPTEESRWVGQVGLGSWLHMENVQTNALAFMPHDITARGMSAP